MEKNSNINDNQINTSTKNKDTSCLGLFFNAMAYNAVISPVKAIAQVADKVDSSHLTGSVNRIADILDIHKPKPVKFGTLNWASTQIGGAIGMMLPYMLTYKSLSLIGDSAIVESNSPTLAKFLAKDTLISRESILSAGSGLAYGSLLDPSESTQSGFFKDRLTNGLVDMATFGSLGLSNASLDVGLKDAAGKISNSSMRSLITAPLTRGLTASIPTGLAMSEINSLANGSIFPSAINIKHNILSMAILGGVFASTDSLLKSDNFKNSNINSKSINDINNFQPISKTSLKIEDGNLPSLTKQEKLGDNPVGDLAKTNKHDLVLGVGGVVAAYEGAGAIKAFEESGLTFSVVSGGSAGADLAALYTNGFTSDEILKINLKARENMLTNPFLMWDSIIWPEPKQWNVSKSIVSLEHPWLEKVKELNLKPNDHLQIWAYDPVHSEPVLFKGTNYDLAKALAATGAYPNVFAAVMHDGNALIDGGFYKANTDEFSSNPSLVLKFTSNPQLDPSVEKEDSLVIDLRQPDINGLDFGLAESKCKELFNDGYHKTLDAINKAIASGKLKV